MQVFIAISLMFLMGCMGKKQTHTEKKMASADTVAFQDFEKLINDNLESADSIPISWVEKFTNLSESLFQNSSRFGGWWTSQEFSSVKLVYLEHADSNYQRKIFVTFDDSNKQLDSLIFVTRCIKCSTSDLFVDISFFNSSGRDLEIQAVSYPPEFNNSKPLPSQKNIIKKERWGINKTGIFQMRNK